MRKENKAAIYLGQIESYTLREEECGRLASGGVQ